MITYEHFHASEVTKEDEKYLCKLRIEDIGLIWEDYKDHRKDRRCYVLIARASKGHPIAWGLLYFDKGDHEWVFSVFVKKNHRRKGIGTKIYRKMKRKHHFKNTAVHVYRHDEKSIQFFNKLQA